MNQSKLFLVAVVTIFSVCGSTAHSAIINVSASNYAADYATYTYDDGGGIVSTTLYNNVIQNNDVNSYAYVSDSSSQVNYPYLSSYAYASNGTDFSTYIYAQSENATYGDPNSSFGIDVYESVTSQSAIYFTFTEDSTADLFLRAVATTNYPGDAGYNHAYAVAELYNNTTGSYYYYYADAIGGGDYNFSTSLPLFLQAGDYRVTFGYSYAYGYSSSGDGINSESSYALVELYNIQAVPEPSTLMLFAIGLVGIGGMTWRKRRVTV